MQNAWAKDWLELRLSRWILTALLAILLQAGHSVLAQEIQRTTIGLASAFEATHITVQAAEIFQELVEERSNGEITVNIFAGGAMGGEEDVTESVSIGAVQMQAGGGIPIFLFAREYYFVDTPFVMRDRDHFMQVWNSHLGDELRQQVLEEGSIEFLGTPIYRGIRRFTSNRPVRTPEDVRGMRLRLPVLDTWVRIWEEIGAAPVPVPLHELYSALATGVADASEGDMEQLWSFRLFEVQNHLSLTNHHVQVGFLTINTDYLRGLNEATQNLILEAAEEATAQASNIALEREEELIEQYVAQGVTLVEADREAFEAAAAPAVERLFTTHFPVTTWEEILDIGE